MITIRELMREEIEQIWDIDRSEVIENVYYFENEGLSSLSLNISKRKAGHPVKQRNILRSFTIASIGVDGFGVHSTRGY